MKVFLKKLRLLLSKAEITFSATILIRLNQIILSVKLRKFNVLIYHLIDILHKCYLKNKICSIKYIFKQPVKL